MTHLNIQRASFLRHAHSEPAGGDENRVLSSKGLAQAFSLKKMIEMDYDLVISSTARRTIETAEILLMASSKPIPLCHLKSLYLPTSPNDINDISKMLTAYPYASPKEMLSYDASGAWQRYTESAYEDIISTASQYNATKLLIICHSTIANLLGIRFTGVTDGLIDLHLSPCHGFSIIFKSV